MTQIEVDAGCVYCQTDSVDEMLLLIAFLQANVARMETRGQKAVTIFESFDLEPPHVREREREGAGDDKETDE